MRSAAHHRHLKCLKHPSDLLVALSGYLNCYGCFRAVNPDRRLTPPCPFRPDDFFMGNDGYRECTPFRKLSARVCSTPENGQSQLQHLRLLSRLSSCRMELIR